MDDKSHQTIKCCKRCNTYSAVRYKPGMEDGFVYYTYDDRKGYWFPGDPALDPKKVELKIPILKITNIDEYAHHWNEIRIPEDGWILTNVDGYRSAISDKDFQNRYVIIL